MKENPTPLPRPPNQEILKHEQMRMVESKVYSLEKKLKASAIDQSEIAKQCDELRQQLLADIDKGVSKPTTNLDQSSRQAKQAHMEVFK